MPQWLFNVHSHLGVDCGTDSDGHLLFLYQMLELGAKFFLKKIDGTYLYMFDFISFLMFLLWFGHLPSRGKNCPLPLGCRTPTESVKSKENIVQHYLYMSLTRCLTEPTPVVSCSRFAPVAIRAAFTMHGPNGWFSRGSFGTLHSFYRTPSYFHCSLLLV